MSSGKRRGLQIVALAAASCALGSSSASAQSPLKYAGTTEQGRPMTLTVHESTVRFSFSFDAVCAGERLTIPIESSARLTETGAFFDEGTFAGGSSTYRIVGDRPSGRTRTGTVSLTSEGCEPVHATWAAQRPAIVTGDACADPEPSRRLFLEKLTVRRISCATGRRAATQWATRCHQEQWRGGADRCRFRAGGRRWIARMRAVGGPGSGGYSRITITSRRARATFYAHARPIA